MRLDGLLLVDKPAGPTSHDVVLGIRRLARGVRVGHTGTLDPMATGLLVVCLGRATRLSRYVTRSRKLYEGALRLGRTTDTYDAEGRTTSSADPSAVTRAQIEEAAETLTGAILQAPPIYSARKVMGRRLHEVAREGGRVDLVPVSVTVHRFEIRDVSVPAVEFLVETCAGVYVRSLVHDLGRILGCGAHMTRLRRLASGPYRVEDALAPAAIARAGSEGGLASLLTPLSRIDLGLPTRRTDRSGAVALRAGRALVVEEDGLTKEAADGVAVRVEDEAGDLVGVARFEVETTGRLILRPQTMLPA